MTLILYSKHKPVTSDDLLKAFETVIEDDEFDFTAAFRSWETQTGFPLVHVSVDVERSAFHVTQERYYAESETRIEEDDRSWFIPLNYATSASDFDDLSFSHFFTNDQSDTAVPLPADFDLTQWFIFNKGQYGFYRVNYDQSNWNELIKVLNSDKFEDIHVRNRAQLIDDSLNLAADGYLLYQTVFELLTYLGRETDYIPWKAALNNLDKIDYIVKDQPIHAYFKTFIKQLLRRMYVHYGFEEKDDDTYTDKFARELAIDWTCRMGDEKCLEKSYKILKASIDKGEEISASLEVTIMCNGMKGLNRRNEFFALWNRFQVSEDQAERLRIIDGITCSSDPTVIKDLLQTVLSNNYETFYRTHEKQRIINNVYVKSSVGIAVMAEFISESYDDIVSE